MRTFLLTSTLAGAALCASLMAWPNPTRAQAGAEAPDFSGIWARANESWFFPVPGDAEGKGGINHLCFEVENIDEALAELKTKGIPLLDEVPRPGHAGCRIAFIDPKATEGCLIELAELPKGHAHAH